MNAAVETFLVALVTLVGVHADNYGSNQKQPAGIGAYAYQDSSGNRYGGTYDLTDQDIPNFAQYAPDFSKYAPDFSGGYGGFPFAAPGADFYAQFVKSLQQSLEQAFPGNVANQQAAWRSVNSAFDETYGHAGGAGPYQGQGQGLGGYQHPAGANSAYAAGSVGPQGTRQVASISPPNPNQPNVDVSSRSGGGRGGGGGGGYRSVSSSSFASSSDIDGRRSESRGAKTVVNDNGKVTEYNTHS